MNARDTLDSKICDNFSTEFSNAFDKLSDEEVGKLSNHLKQYNHQLAKDKK